jgi:hypothetical protein
MAIHAKKLAQYLDTRDSELCSRYRFVARNICRSLDTKWDDVVRVAYENLPQCCGRGVCGFAKAGFALPVSEGKIALSRDRRK